MPFRRTYILSALLLVACAIKAQDPISLKKALQAARAGNPTLKAEQYNANLAQADIITARLRPNPTLNNQTLQLLRSSNFPAGTDWHNGQNRQVWWQLTKPFQVAGQRRYKIELAEKSAAYAEKNYAETERRLFLDVANGWLDVWAAQKQSDIIRVAKNNTDSLVAVNRLRLKNQVITQADLIRTELLAGQYALQYKSAKQDVRNKENSLRYLLGLKDSLRIDTTDRFLFNGPAEIDSLVGIALQQRSDIQASTAWIGVSKANIQLQKSLAFPQPELGVIWNPQNTIPYIGLYATIDLPVFSRNQGEIRKSYILKDQAEQQLSAGQSKMRSEISIAWADYQLQRQSMQSFELLLEQSQTILDNIRYAYLKGGTTVIDFLEAQRSWIETRQHYYDTLQQYRRSYIQLLYATGMINQLAQ